MPTDRPRPPPLILASRSPRRAALLRAAGLEFEIGPFPDVDETVPSGANARDAVEALARRKAEAMRFAAGRHRVLVADTLVFLDGEALGKPGTPARAREMLGRLSARTHQVATGVGVVGPDGCGGTRLCVGSRVTEVRFRALRPQEIEAYVATGEPLDKAGAYAIQAGGRAFVSALSGAEDTVIGLPLELVWTLLRDDGGLGR